MSNEQGTYSVFRSVINNNTNLPPNLSPDFNETIHFSGDIKTYKELVYSSRVKDSLNLPIEVLTSDSKTSRIALRNKKKGTKVIPRPQNAWIIYRRNRYAGPEFEGIKSSIASSVIGEGWRNESNEVLEYFIALSMLALENHQKKYGDYKYKPRQRIRISKKSKDRQRQNENIENTSPETKISTDLPQFVVIPSPTNEYPTPVSSIAHSPVASQDYFSEQTINNSYLITPASSIIPSPTNEYPTPVSSIAHSPVASQDDFSEQTINNSYLITPASSIQHSPITFQNGSLNDPLTDQQYSFITLGDLNPTMYPNLSAINPVDFSSYMISEDVSEFLNNADNLTFLQSSSAITTNMDDDIIQEDFDLYPENLYPENETLIDIFPPTVEATTDINQLLGCNILEYDPFSINVETPFLDQLNYYDNNGHPFSE